MFQQLLHMTSFVNCLLSTCESAAHAEIDKTHPAQHNITLWECLISLKHVTIWLIAISIIFFYYLTHKVEVPPVPQSLVHDRTPLDL